MALLKDELGERTEMPTPLRLKEARQRGHVARSGDVVSVSLFAAGLATLAVCGPNLLRALTEMTAKFLGPGGADAPARELSEAVASILPAVAAIIIVPVVVAVLANLVQVGLLASSEPLKADAGRLSPVVGLGRLFSRRSLVRTVQAVAKLAAVAAVCLVTIPPALPRIAAAAASQPADIVAEAGALTLRLGLRLAVALGVLAGIDWLYQRWQHRQDLKITRRELLDDLRRMEGDRHAAGRRRRIARQLASQRLAVAVPAADVVVADSSTRALVIRHDATMPAPCVTGRAGEALAGRVRQLAETHGVPIVEDRRLAAAIYRACRVGDQVPPRLYGRVAEVLAFCKAANPGNAPKGSGNN